MELLKSNKYIREYLKNFSPDKHHQLIENILIVGIDLIKKIYEPSEILFKIKKIANNIVHSDSCPLNLQESSIKEDIQKIQEEISKLNEKFESEITACNCKRPPQRPQNNPLTEKKCKKPIKPPKRCDSQKRLQNINTYVTPKVTEIMHSFVKKPSPLLTKHHLDDTEIRKVFKNSNFEEDDFHYQSPNENRKGGLTEQERLQHQIHEKRDKPEKKSSSPPQKLTSPDSQKNISSRSHLPRYLKKVGSKIKDMVNHHKKLNSVYKKYQKEQDEYPDFKEELGYRISSEEENYKYRDFFSTSKNALSSEKTEKGKSYEINIINPPNNQEDNTSKDQKKDDVLSDNKSPKFLNVESQYLDRDHQSNNNNNENSHFKPRTLEFEKTSNFSSNFNTKYNNFSSNNGNLNNFIESSGSKKRSDNNFNYLGPKKEISKILTSGENDFDTKYSRTADHFNEKESSVSSNFSMFQPNEELKTFYQKELWNNHSFQKKTGQGANYRRGDDESDQDDFGD